MHGYLQPVEKVENFHNLKVLLELVTHLLMMRINRYLLGLCRHPGLSFVIARLSQTQASPCFSIKIRL